MTGHRSTAARRPIGFTLIEIMIVLVMVGAMLALALPRIDLTRYRTDAAVQGVRSVLMQAQRTALVRQYDVVISIDTTHNALLWAEDVNNDGTIQSTEHKRSYPLNDGVVFMIPPVGLDSAVSSAVVGNHLGTMGGLPTITFHRDGAATSDLQLYLAGPANPTRTYRAVRLTQGTGRTDWYLYNSQANNWTLGGLNQ
ncbi:MAG: prepilin-type N-terminal cleavage/methylation domain-containing protein [Gemmatimonadota bacterium]|nr:prepilin-type N-terminal cleavage/methylation domain-containing protein [Gemmatimonadota bacterium]